VSPSASLCDPSPRQIEEIVLSTLAQVGLAQVTTGVFANEERQVRLFAHGFVVVQPFLENHVCSRQSERRVRLVPHGNPEIGVDRARGEIRRDHHDLGPAVARLVDEVDVGNARVRGVCDPEHDVVGEEPVVRRAVGVVHTLGLHQAVGHVAHAGPGIQQRGPHGDVPAQLGRRVGSVVAVRGAVVVDDGLGAGLERGVDTRVCDLVVGLLPADPLPLALAALAHALHRVEDARLAQVQIAVTRPFLAAPRVEVGYPLARGRIDRVLLFAPDDAVLHEEIERAGGETVGAVVASLGHPVPLPLRAIDVGPVAVRDAPRRRRHHVGIHETLARPRLQGIEAQRYAGGSHPGADQEVSSRDSHAPRPPRSNIVKLMLSTKL
jgi:hypothetical protein